MSYFAGQSFCRRLAFFFCFNSFLDNEQSYLVGTIFFSFPFFFLLSFFFFFFSISFCFILSIFNFFFLSIFFFFLSNFFPIFFSFFFLLLVTIHSLKKTFQKRPYHKRQCNFSSSFPLCTLLYYTSNYGAFIRFRPLISRRNKSSSLEFKMQDNHRNRIKAEEKKRQKIPDVFLEVLQ